jgi:DNA mismatch endonuclease (patch repair protein)
LWGNPYLLGWGFFFFMADVHDKETRSYNMSRIRSKDTKPEMLVRKFLFAKGFRYRVNDKKLPGKPDIVLPKYKTVIFVHGCFWHGHEGCRYYVVPKTRTEWWLEKIGRNKGNDEKKNSALREKGWKVIEIWECELKLNAEKKMIRVLNKLK